MKILSRRNGSDGSAKYLIGLGDGLTIETMFLPSKHRRTICVSSQVGCVLDCAFCATGTMGFKRNLTAEEITGQVRLIMEDQTPRTTPEGGETIRPTNIVFMGMGEPFYNFDAVLEAAKSLSDQRTFNIAPGRITISTAGVLPRIQQMLALDLPFKLAVSLTSAVPEKRSRLMPINDRFPLGDLRQTIERLPVRAQRRVMLEIPLLRGVNDGPEDARALADFCAGLPVRINLIPWNPVHTGSDFARPETDQVLAFQKILRRDNRPVFIRRSLGLELQGACGQLWLEHGETAVAHLT